MKIGFFTDTYLPVTHGVVISINTFKNALEKMGHQVYIYAPRAPNYKDKNNNVFRFNSVVFIKEPELRFAFPVFPQEEFKDASKFKLDIAHAHTPFSMGLLAKYIAKKQKIPVVYTHHTHYPEYAKVYLKEKILIPQLAKLYCSWFANMVDGVICPSLKIKKLVRNYGVKKNIPIDVVLTGIDLNKFKPSPEMSLKIRNKLKIPQSKKILLFVGRINQEKNVEFLVEVAATLSQKRKDFVLLMVGDGAIRRDLIKKVAKMKLGKFVKLLGLIPYVDVPHYYQAADLFLFPSLTDTQGIVLLEAMACSTPVVTLKDDAFADVVKNNINGFVVDRQSDKIFARKIASLLDNAKLYKQMAAEAENTARLFSEELQAEKLIKVYQKYINK